MWTPTQSARFVRLMGWTDLTLYLAVYRVKGLAALCTLAKSTTLRLREGNCIAREPALTTAADAFRVMVAHSQLQ